MEQIELNLSGCATREELHSRIRDALDFPPYYGMNLDALFDMLTTESRPLRLVVCYPIPARRCAPTGRGCCGCLITPRWKTSACR